MGGMQERLPKLMEAMGWKLHPVPFYFRVLKHMRFLANIKYLRRQQHRRLALDALRYTGLGGLGFRIAQFRIAMVDSSVHSQPFHSFEKWADELWDRTREEYSLISLRDSKTLNIIYPQTESRFLRLKVVRGKETLGWVVMRDTQLSRHKVFGDMRLGIIVDCLSRPEHALPVIQIATRYLEDRGVDMIVSNQASSAWCKALARSGFLNAPSTSILCLSPKLSERLYPFEVLQDNIHMNRGNGHGPVLEW
jgi:hypothetical protein